MTTIKDLLDARARAMAAHDEDNYGPIYIVGAANAIIADVLNARDDLLTAAPAAGAEIAPTELVVEPSSAGPGPEPVSEAAPSAANPAPEPEATAKADPAPAEDPKAEAAPTTKDKA